VDDATRYLSILRMREHAQRCTTAAERAHARDGHAVAAFYETRAAEYTEQVRHLQAGCDHGPPHDGGGCVLV
jgi:hypothetical protein